MMDGDWSKTILLIIVLVSTTAYTCWFISSVLRDISTARKNTDAEAALYRQAVERSTAQWELYRQGVDVAKETNRLRGEEMELMRELIAALRDRK
jgi:hypothetical protein